MIRFTTGVFALGAIAMASPSVMAGATFIGPLEYVCASDSPFEDVDACGPVFLETVEDGAVNTPGVAAMGVTVIGPGGLTDSVDCDDGVTDGSGTNGRSIFFGSGATGITFTFDARALGGLPTHAGIVWADGSGNATFEAFGPDDESLGTIGPVAVGDASFVGGTDEDRFFGVINEAGVLRIRISNTSGGIEVDHLQYGTPNGGGECAPADLNCSGAVNAADLAILLGAWSIPAGSPGCAGASCCPADLNSDGLVNAADLAILLGAWTLP